MRHTEEHPRSGTRPPGPPSEPGERAEGERTYPQDPGPVEVPAGARGRFRIEAIPPALVREARRTRKAPGYGHPVHVEVARGYGPCRSCLEPFREGADRRLLFTYDPFLGLEPYPLPGPVFVHETGCPPYPAPDRFPDALRFIPMTLNAYGRERRLRDVVRVEPHGPVQDAVEALLGRDDVDYIHVRNTEAGCFMFHVARARS